MSTERALSVVREAETNYVEEFEVSENEANVSIVESSVGANESVSESAFVSSAFRVAFALLAEVLVGTGRIVRRVSPNERPEERYEFENPDHKNVRGPGFPIF